MQDCIGQSLISIKLSMELWGGRHTNCTVSSKYLVYERNKKGMCQALMASCKLDSTFLKDSEFILQEARGYVGESLKLAV